MKTIADFLTHFRRQRIWTRKLVAAIPEQHFDWAPAQDAFRCSDLVRHMMQAEIFWRRLFTAAIGGEQYDPFKFPGSPSDRYAAFRARNLQISQSEKLGRSPAGLLEQWERIQADSERELGAITPEQLDRVEVEHPLAGIRLPLWEMLLVMLEHEIHHRGQLSAYLKQLGVAQPVLFSNE